MNIPEEGEHLWEWFWVIISSGRRVIQGEAYALTYQELLAWSRVTEQFVRPYEFQILMDMSVEWAKSTQEEINVAHAKAVEEAKINAKK